VGQLPFTTIPPVSTTISAEADQLARSKFLDRCISARKSWRGGNFLAEVVETIHQLRHPLEGLATGLGAFTRGVGRVKGYWLKGEIDAYAKHVSNLWLEYTFGWAPLFQDIKDANAALHRLGLGGRADTKRISATGHVTTSVFNPPAFSGLVGGVGGPGFYQDSFKKSTAYVKYVGALRARPASLSGILDDFGVSPTDVIPAIWEAVPWSFFIDYFLNVQEQLDSMQFALADFGWIEQGVRNVTANYLTGSRCVAHDLPTHFDCEVRGFDRRSSSEYKKRSAIASVPFPSFHFRIPGLGSLKWVNTGALIQQIRASRP
jgi:hypothetical protein